MKTKLMGILNVTPDSFYDKYGSYEQAIERAKQIILEGADYLDIGGESTRPGSSPISLDEEMSRVIPVIKGVKEMQPIKISLDTSKPEVAEEGLKAGASMINDVSGASHPDMIKVVRDKRAEIIVMHSQGVPKTMQINPSYDQGVMTEIMGWFRMKIDHLLKEGILPHHILLDPGIGFGKTVADNLEILHNLPRLKSLGFPIVIGLSRKSFMSKALNMKTADLLAPTIAANTYAILKGADMIRVHDIKEHRSVIDLLELGFTLS